MSPLAANVAQALLSRGHELFKSDRVKYSLHASGRFHQAERPRIECFKLSKRRYISLATILHRPLELIYPVSETKKPTFAIQADHLTNVVVASTIYLRRANCPTPPVVETRRSKYPTFELHEYEFGEYVLCVALYTAPDRLNIALPASMIITMPISQDHEAHEDRNEPREAFVWL